MAKREPNACLSRLLGETGGSQSRFATAVNRIGTEQGTRLRYDASAVSHWLTGTTPRREVRPLILEALARKLARPVTHADAGFPMPTGQPQSTTVEGLLELGRHDMDPSRRGVLGAALFSAALTIPDWPNVVGRMEAVRTGRTHRIGYAEVDAVVAMTDKVSELDDVFGGRHARPMAAAFLVNTVTPHLRADASDGVRKAMLSAASDLLYLTGYMAVDEGLHGLAQRYYVKALELAGAADDRLTYCTTLRGMSLQAVDLGHHAHALRLADAAAAASRNAGPRMRAFLSGQQAHAYAAGGDRVTALRYIREAEVAMDKAESRAKTFGSYDPSSLAYHIAQVQYGLGDLSGSVKNMKESSRLRHDVYRRTRVRYDAMLAERQLELGHLEAACATWHRVLDDYPLVHSGRADERVAVMKALIRPHARNRAAQALYERAQAVNVPATA
ncbi:tetratricopeptide repeat protein [Streptomyces sp. F63]|uniref:tetratricopeptide repeat protein n=1 Tax=Streptomyces sp. F63 TaxID=2824887 RepID=UPI001B37EB37|nr:tetratricopeptide repeat protein [Streptomyces sp. F63]MBQ0983146.1 tetratricopeptide repeat protein [Streptomyces sp. F63]